MESKTRKKKEPAERTLLRQSVMGDKKNAIKTKKIERTSKANETLKERRHVRMCRERYTNKSFVN